MDGKLTNRDFCILNINLSCILTYIFLNDPIKHGDQIHKKKIEICMVFNFTLRKIHKNFGLKSETLREYNYANDDVNDLEL